MMFVKCKWLRYTLQFVFWPFVLLKNDEVDKNLDGIEQLAVILGAGLLPMGLLYGSYFSTYGKEGLDALSWFFIFFAPGYTFLCAFNHAVFKSTGKVSHPIFR